MRAIRHSDRPRGRTLRALYGIFRFLLYGIIGLAAEMSFYSLTRIGRHIPIVELLFRFGWHVDPELHLDGPWNTPLRVLYGQASLWILGMTSLYIAPIWCLTGLLVELIYRELMDPRVRTALEAELTEPARQAAPGT